MQTFEAGHSRDLAERGLTAGGTHIDVVLPLGDDALTWDEFQPALYELTVELVTDVGGSEHRHVTRTVFGLREVGVDETQVTINGRRTFIRGTLESCVFPLTGYPPTDVDSWRRIVAVCQAHGLNLLRFHSWCPPEAAFQAADEAGFYVQVEGPVWANQGAALGEGRPVDAFLYEETRRILDAYGNHPSFIMMAHGNEPGGRDAEFLAAWVNTWRTYDPRRLYTSGAGWPAITENDFDNIPDPRAHRWGEGLESRLNGHPPETEADYREWVQSRPRPIISHEIGQWCAYPDFTETAKYTGLMEPRNFGIFADFLREAGMADQAEAFLHASGRLQLLCYKEDIEAALRTEGFGGFHLLGLSDFPGQGTALVGVLNPFWESKGYSTPEEFARFCGPTVPLARLPRRVWTADQEIEFEVQIAHFGPTPLDADVRWSLLRSPTARSSAAASSLGGAHIPIGNGTRFGPVVVPAGLVSAPAQVRLVVSGGRTPPAPPTRTTGTCGCTRTPSTRRQTPCWSPPRSARPSSGRAPARRSCWSSHRRASGTTSPWGSHLPSGTLRGPRARRPTPSVCCTTRRTRCSATSPPRAAPTGSGGSCCTAPRRCCSTSSRRGCGRSCSRSTPGSRHAGSGCCSRRTSGRARSW